MPERKSILSLTAGNFLSSASFYNLAGNVGASAV
jgi:hypothetical protein